MILALGTLAARRARTDIFPEVDLPVVTVILYLFTPLAVVFVLGMSYFLLRTLVAPAAHLLLPVVGHRVADSELWPAPIDVQVGGYDGKKNLEIAQQIVGHLKQIPGVVDVHRHRVTAVPTLRLEVDQTRARQLGLSQQEVANQCSSRFPAARLPAPTRDRPDQPQLLTNLA